MPENHEAVTPQQLEEAYLTNNLFTLDAFVFEKNNSIAGQIDVIGKVLTAHNELAELRFEETRQKLTAQLIPDETTSAVKDILVEYRITTPIDDRFIADLSTIHSSGIEAANMASIDADLLRNVKDTAIQTALQDLELRRQIQSYERQLETVEVVPLTVGKQLTIRVPGGAESIELSVNMDVDPRTEPVKLGPDAVVAVLGARLTDEDYDAIAERAIQLPGEVGNICREQFEAAAVFAESVQELGSAGRDAERRISFADEKLAVLLYKDSFSYNPAFSIFRLALNRSAMRQFTPYSTGEIPQPFSS